jgi:hypothetical protein
MMQTSCAWWLIEKSEFSFYQFKEALLDAVGYWTSMSLLRRFLGAIDELHGRFLF